MCSVELWGVFLFCVILVSVSWSNGLAVAVQWWRCWKQQADKQTSYKDLPRNMIPVPSTVDTTPIMATVQPSLL